MKSDEIICFVVSSYFRALDIGDVGFIGISGEDNFGTAPFEVLFDYKSIS